MIAAILLKLANEIVWDDRIYSMTADVKDPAVIFTFGWVWESVYTDWMAVTVVFERFIVFVVGLSTLKNVCAGPVKIDNHCHGGTWSNIGAETVQWNHRQTRCECCDAKGREGNYRNCRISESCKHALLGKHAAFVQSRADMNPVAEVFNLIALSSILNGADHGAVITFFIFWQRR